MNYTKETETKDILNVKKEALSQNHILCPRPLRMNPLHLNALGHIFKNVKPVGCSRNKVQHPDLIVYLHVVCFFLLLLILTVGLK